MLELASGKQVDSGALVRLKPDPSFATWDQMYGGKIAVLVGREWSRELGKFLYTVLVDGNVIYVEQEDIGEEINCE